jgi:hypothetical protein
MYHQGRHVETLGSSRPHRGAARQHAGRHGQLPGSEALRGTSWPCAACTPTSRGGQRLALAEQALQRLPVACVHAHVTAQALLAGTGGRPPAIWPARATASMSGPGARVGPIDACQAPLVATLCLIDWMAADLSALQWTARPVLQPGRCPLCQRGERRSRALLPGPCPVSAQRAERWPRRRCCRRSRRSRRRASAIAPKSRSFWRQSIRRSGRPTGRARSSMRSASTFCRESRFCRPCFAPGLPGGSRAAPGPSDEAQDWARSFDPGPVQFVYRFFSAPHLTLAGCG